jgi:carboxypeptidase PM20D1
MPARQTAIGILSKAIARLEAHPMPAHLEVVEFMMSYLGPVLPFKQRLDFANTWLFGKRLKKQLAKSNLMNASMRTTTAPTIIKAGVKDNVLPAKAEAVVNFRLLPGDNLAMIYEMVLERINDERVSVTPYEGDLLEGPSGWDPSPVADVESPYFIRLSRLVQEAFTDTVVSPFLVIGGTDARHYAPVTDNAFRFTPARLDKAGLQSIHAVNERISFENCAVMVGFYIAYIEEMANLPAAMDALSEAADDAEETSDETLEDITAWEDDEDLLIPSLEETMAVATDEDEPEPFETEEESKPED